MFLRMALYVNSKQRRRTSTLRSEDAIKSTHRIVDVNHYLLDTARFASTAPFSYHSPKTNTTEWLFENCIRKVNLVTHREFYLSHSQGSYLLESIVNATCMARSSPRPSTTLPLSKQHSTLPLHAHSITLALGMLMLSANNLPLDTPAVRS
jgi:hypothetical protein